MNTKKLLSTILIIGGICLAIFTVGRGLYYSPDSKDSGLPIAQPVSAEGVVVTSASVTEYPSRILVPKLEIDAHVQHLGVTESGNMAAPSNFSDVSWYKFGTIPGRRGSAVVAGHEDNGFSLDGVFKRLEELEIGDDVYVVRRDGKRLHFKVVDTQIYPYDNAPLEKIFSTSDTTRLNLITCAGDWVPSAKTNDQRLVVYTKLVDN